MTTILADLDLQFLWKQFGPLGLALAFAVWVASILFTLWVAIKTNANLHALKLVADRDAIRFSKLHEKRAQIIKALYDKLLHCSHAAMKYVTEDTKENRLAFFGSMIEFGNYYKEHKLYFGEKVCDKIDDVHKLMFDAVGEKFAYPHLEKQMNRSQKMLRDINVLTAVSPEILAELEREFRLLLGVEVDLKRKVKMPTFIPINAFDKLKSEE